jgi:hypothetical protein
MALQVSIEHMFKAGEAVVQTAEDGKVANLDFVRCALKAGLPLAPLDAFQVRAPNLVIPCCPCEIKVRC